MAVLSIQSHVVAGSVGNTAAGFCLRRSGVECYELNTLQFSNHTGYDGFTGRVFSKDDLDDLIAGVEKYVGFSDCDGVLSGYLGSTQTGAAVASAVDKVKKANSAALYCCDPVMGDNGEIYVSADIPDFIKTVLLPEADLITPNYFEFEVLCGRKISSVPDGVRSARDLLSAYGKIRSVVVTNFMAAADELSVLAVTRQAAFIVKTPKIKGYFVGTGDAFAALFLAQYIKTGAAERAASLAASSLYGIVAKTAALDGTELKLVAAQDEIASPSKVFVPERLAGFCVG